MSNFQKGQISTIGEWGAGLVLREQSLLLLPLTRLVTAIVICLSLLFERLPPHSVDGEESVCLPWGEYKVVVVWLTLKFFHFSTRPPNACKASTGLGPIRLAIVKGNSVESGPKLLLLLFE